MLLKDVLFSQGFGTRYDCAAMVASGAVEIAAEVHDDPDEDVETEGLVFRCLGTDWPYFEKAIIALNKPAGYECSMKPSAHPSCQVRFAAATCSPLAVSMSIRRAC